MISCMILTIFLSNHRQYQEPMKSMANCMHYCLLFYVIVYDLKNLWYLSHMISFIFHVIMSAGKLSSWNLIFQAGTWNFKVKGSGFDLPSWVTICASFDIMIYVQAGTSGCKLWKSSSILRVSHLRQEAGWLPVTVSLRLSQHFKPVVI